VSLLKMRAYSGMRPKALPNADEGAKNPEANPRLIPAVKCQEHNYKGEQFDMRNFQLAVGRRSTPKTRWWRHRIKAGVDAIEVVRSAAPRGPPSACALLG